MRDFFSTGLGRIFLPQALACSPILEGGWGDFDPG